ncbi:hypothetical protein BBD41_26150 [Paenibacillus ihbetae]|uniref:Copper amine oxidase-like N-terminal domain-containing protein n=1 Tax=Paenibacillus ihbetae TaxID=1870820 RepID=A0A1B2E753_9BACL|nr:hypothetical protein [Paenibacillus ihbetae]ANY75779.1 hypothetical protein BBD41_26150 [Paenibacillus ihbetae]
MKKLLKTKVLIIFLVTSFFSIFLLPESNASSNVVPRNAYLSGEKSVFLDGDVLVTREKAYSIEKINNPGTYVPVKLLSKLKNVSIDYSKPITVKSNKGTYKINESNSVLLDGTTYIKLEYFYKISGLSGTDDYKSNTIFLWSSKEGKAKSEKLISQLKRVSDDNLRTYMGKKVYIYDGEKIGRVIEIAVISNQTTSVKILLNDGSVVEEFVIGSTPDTFCTYFFYESINSFYAGKHYWANKNQLPSSNPLLNIEKIYFKSVKLKGSNLFVTAKRSNGANVTFKLPFYGDPGTVIKQGFYTVNPKSVFPKWSSATWNRIVQQRIAIGMNQDQVLLSWGAPDDYSSYTGSYITMDQWIYGDTYLHFYNGILESWSDY